MKTKEAYKQKMEEKKIELNTLYEKLTDSVITDPEEIEKFVKIFTGGFHQYSFRNMIIAWIQCPDISLMAGYNDWKKRGRNVMKTQKAISLLAPNTYTKKVEKADGEIEEEFGISGFRLINKSFDLSQTGVPKTISTPDGRTFEVLDPLDMTGVEVGAEQYIKENKNLHFEDFAKSSNLPTKIKKNMGTANGNTNGEEHNIAERKNETAMICTLFHEEIHENFGHIKDSTLSRNEKEIMAEAGSYLVSTFFGIENNKSKFYIGNWGGNKENLKGFGKEVIRAAEQLIKLHLPDIEGENNG